MEDIFAILFEVLLLFYAFDAYADGATDVMCNSIRYIHGIGGPMITVVIIGASLLAIFGRMPWPALFSLGVFVAVFFGAPQIVKKITGKEACCLLEGQMMEDGKCVATDEYWFVGTNGWVPPDKSGWSPCPDGEVANNKRECIDPSTEPLWK
ncbi:MAG: TrbC/VirB2 family protein [Rickettsiales bacterium]|jgi:type IV secretory pathway VirB2 component (pilin)|nr:TrbC/VirB2 family protein [Rickettsiales bacterium]MDR1261797.1 TrbC/VirB2 family protein [Rickettsiales bacterium]